MVQRLSGAVHQRIFSLIMPVSFVCFNGCPAQSRRDGAKPAVFILNQRPRPWRATRRLLSPFTGSGRPQPDAPLVAFTPTSRERHWMESEGLRDVGPIARWELSP